LKLLVVDHEKCVGCNICELVCSAFHEKRFNPALSKIRVVGHDKASLDIPFVCFHCEAPVCEKVCPVKAIGRDPRSGFVNVDYEKCIHCSVCIIKCPYRGFFKDPFGKTIKCDLCGGEPQCVKHCPSNAIKYVEKSPETAQQKRQSMNALLKTLRKHAFVKEAITSLAKG